jgi:hypothetical protein
MQSQFNAFRDRLTREYPSTEPKLTAFPSGAMMLDIKVGAETYVMEYLPSFNAFGVSRMSTAVFGWEGFENAFDDFGKAKEFVMALLDTPLAIAAEKGENLARSPRPSP